MHPLKGVITGTTRSVARKLLMKSSRKLSEERSFPSTLMERGTSGRILTAAFKKASAAGQDQNGKSTMELEVRFYGRIRTQTI